MQTTELYFDGTFAAPRAGGSLQAINPATETVFARIAAVETRDNGKPIPEAEWDVGDAAFVFNYYADLAESHEAEGAQSVDVGDEAFSSSISTEPLGVVGAITPWNFPLLMAVWKVAPALAAGCTIEEEHLDTFEAALQRVAHEWLDAATLERRMEADGALDKQYRRTDLVDTLHKEVWGQGFAPPVFCEEVQIVSQRLVGEKHLALKMKHQGDPVDGIWFGHTEPLPERVKLAFRLDADEWQGQRRVRFLVEAAEFPAASSR